MTLTAPVRRWLTSVACFVPVQGLLVWFAVVQIRERRSRGR
jgi:hypothetical protein